MKSTYEAPAVLKGGDAVRTRWERVVAPKSTALASAKARVL
jgi:hypothetical protein